MEHLYKKTCFITENIYTTSSGIVTANFNDLLSQLKNKTKNESTILCNELPVNEILTLFNDYKVCRDYHNALFTYYPMPLDMIKPQIIHLCIGTFENKLQKIHQISFIKDKHYYRFGISI